MTADGSPISPSRRRPSGTLAAGLAAGLGVLSALVSLYWLLGGTVGLDTVGGTLEELGRSRDPGLIAVLVVTVALKLLAAAIGLAVTQRWRLGVPRRLVVAAAWLAAAVLTLYGGVLTVAGLLVQAGVLHSADGADQRALLWHTYLWDPWFLVWGLLLGTAVWQSRGRGRSDQTRDGDDDGS